MVLLSGTKSHGHSIDPQLPRAVVLGTVYRHAPLEMNIARTQQHQPDRRGASVLLAHAQLAAAES